MLNLTNLKWSESHGAINEHSGCGALYYAFTYMLRSKRCVCLGSGGGFVPSAMVKAQRLLIQENIIQTVDVTLVDANVGPWGLPLYKDQSYFDSIGYPEIKLVAKTTNDAASLFDNIDYLHIDADHSYGGVLSDIYAYKDRMSKNSIITLHDTDNAVVCGGVPLGVWKAAQEFVKNNPEYGIVNLHVGAGTAILGSNMGKYRE